MAKRPAGEGHNSGDPTRADWLEALAFRAIIDEKIKELTTLRSRRHKLFNAKGIEVGALNRAIKMSEASTGEVMAWLRKQAAALMATRQDEDEFQADLFKTRKENPVARERSQAVRYQGLMAGLNGAKGEPPEQLLGPDVQDWLTGFHEGYEQWEVAQAMFKRQTEGELDEDEDEDEDEGGGGGDGGGDVPAGDVREESRADFAEDHPEEAARAAVDAVSAPREQPVVEAVEDGPDLSEAGIKAAAEKLEGSGFTEGAKKRGGARGKGKLTVVS